MNIREKLDDLIAVLRSLVETAKTLPGFNTPNEVKSLIASFAKGVEAGGEKPITTGEVAIDALRNKIGGFIYFSVTDQEAVYGISVAKAGRLNKEFALRKEERYDKDILSKLAVAIGALVRAVNEEKGEVLDRRVAAYREAHKAFSEADDEQKKRDENRQKRQAVSKKERMAVEAQEATARNNKRDSEAREEVLKERREVAREILELIS